MYKRQKGQYPRYSNFLDNHIEYFADVDGMQVYFTKEGLTYRYDETIKQDETTLKKLEADGEENEHSFKTLPHFIHMDWEGANPNVEIITEDKVSYYFTYGSFEDKNLAGIKAFGFKKIIYKNLYPNIDLEYIFPKDSSGVKYSLIVHPGGNISDIKMRYKNAENILLLANGNLKIETAFGDFVDHAPITFYADNQQKIASAFSQTNNTISFSVALTNRATYSGDIIIDPWTTNPTYTGFNSAYDVNFDLKGNVYTHGSYSPYKVAKFNSSGVLQWIFNAALGDVFLTRITYGDFAVDENSGSIYVTEGFNDNGSGARILKINNGGIQVATFPGTSSFQEMWRAEYNRCINKIVIAGGGHVATQAAVLDTTLASLTSVNVLSTGEIHHDMALLAVDNVSNNCYMATSRSGTYPGTDDNVIIKCPIPCLLYTSPSPRD